MSNYEMKNISDDLFKLLMQIHHKLLNPSEVFKGDQLPPSHIKVIFYLSAKKCISVSDVAKKLDISKPNMTPIIDKLISEGFVSRYTDPNDRRKIQIELTEKAHLFLNDKKSEIKENLITKISLLEDDDLNKLSLSIKNMTDVISKLT